ncbi:unnamed protein product [Hymenolepis diminuta]|uniref:Ovule protein n=1 Tax=Hymenolepis diminuta TaxID=6216 RepID=A0A0R3SLT3_HYMDI|nr:unnamed protein product [Hymenolepis diminuta]
MKEDNAHLSSLALSSSDRVECMQFGKELPSNLRAYYTPPSSFVIPEIQAQANLTSSSSSPQMRPIFLCHCEKKCQALCHSDIVPCPGWTL